MAEQTTKSGWGLVADEDEAASVIAGLLDIDADRVYTRSELAEATGLPLKTLYLIDLFDELATVGMLDRIDDGSESEARFRIDDDSEVYQAAKQFDEVFAANR